ncbi:MAG: ATP-dependent DNA helicase, partial [Candidatus Saccharimonadales bacterium]
LIADSLQAAIDQADESGKQTAITAWRNEWMQKDLSANFVLKSSVRQEKLRGVAGIYYEYLLRMQIAELYDFDDMILRVVHAMELFPELLYNLQEKYQYIMVDEFQDTNLAQMRVLHNLTTNEVNGGRPNIMVVGDDDQAIYSFQGADISNILNFKDSFTNPAVITLTDNYRSADPVLSHARAVIIQGEERLETLMDGINKTLTAHRSNDGSRVKLLQLATKHDERHQLVMSIAEGIAAGQSPDSIAVLARRHHEIIALLPYFADAGIAVNYERRDNVLDIEPIKLIELTAKVIVAIHESRHDDANALLPEMLAHPAWDVAPTDVWQLSLVAYNQHTSWMEVMPTLPLFVAFHRWVVTVSQQIPHQPLEYMLDIIIGRTTPDGCDYTSPLFEYFFPTEKLTTNPDEYLVYLEALRTIRGKLREYQPQTTPTLPTLLNFIALHRQMNSVITSVRPPLDNQHGAVNLMTAHKSKGLEWDTVYIIGAVDSAWGERVRSRSRNISYPENLRLQPSGDNLNERIRLFFVAMTRARKQLTISFASADDNGKDSLCASFLLSTDLVAEPISFDHNATQRIESAEMRWYEPLVSLSSATMNELLASTLERYKLSATHLNNFLDISRGGPQTFLMNNLLRFPQAMGPAAAYGSAIHKTLQHAHSHLSATKNHRPVEDVLKDFEQNLLDQHLPKSDFDAYLQKGSATLQAFLDQKYDTFRPSQKVELNFAGQQAMIGDARLTGSLDLVDIDSTAKTITVTDYKTGKPSYGWTGKSDYEKIKLHKYKQQLMFYTLLVQTSRDYHSYRVTDGCLQFVEPTPDGDILSLQATFSDDELQRFEQLIRTVWTKITTLDLPDASGYEPNYKGVLAFEADLLGES